MKKLRTTLFGARKKAWREPKKIHGYSDGFRLGRAKRGSYKRGPTKAKKR